MPDSENRKKTLEELKQPVVIVLDDCVAGRVASCHVLSEAGMVVELYASAETLVGKGRFDRPGCLILDVAQPHKCGLRVQAELKGLGIDIPVIFLASSSDISTAVTAMRAGAIDFIEKPYVDAYLLERVRYAIALHCRTRRDDVGGHEALRKLAMLTPRETCVLELVVAGKTCKEIARTLGSSHRTIEKHRLHIMEKMAASTLADLVRMRLSIRIELPGK